MTRPARRVLVLAPPVVPTYFNAGHHLAVFNVGAALRQAGIPFVRCVDAGALNTSYRDLCTELVDGDYDLVAILNDFGVMAPVASTLRYVRALAPDAKVLTFGRLSSQVASLFRRYEPDAILVRGDYEAGVVAYASALDGTAIPGVDVRVDQTWHEGSAGVFLEPDAWPFPDVEEIPYPAYARLYADDSNKFCGIPERMELVVPVARGCPVNCDFCEVPRQDGLKERRRSVGSVVRYIAESFAKRPFEYVAMYAPTFTLRRSWVLELCDALGREPRRYPWKCVTTMHHLDAELLRAMGKSGCVRVSVGLETLDDEARRSLPVMKQKDEVTLEQVAGWCKDAGIELNCFVILGMPGQSAEGARRTIAAVRRVGARVRPTIYTPYQEMRGDAATEELAAYDRQLFVGGRADAKAFYEMAYTRERAVTRVMENIETARESAE